MRSKGKVFHIGELGGILKTLMFERGIAVSLVPPTVLKMLIAGSGSADKKAMRKALLARYALDIPNDDMADAFALLVAGEHFTGASQPPAHIGKSAQAFAELGKKIDTVHGLRLQMIAK